jgi:hypothetical protein
MQSHSSPINVEAFAVQIVTASSLPFPGKIAVFPIILRLQRKNTWATRKRL